jgi:hypothetical protein
MKRITLSPRLLLVAVVAISIPASVAMYAQNTRDMGYHGHFGIMAGVNYNMLNCDAGRFIRLPNMHENLLPEFPTATGTAPYFGLFVEYLGDGALALQLRASLDERRVDAENAGNELHVRLSYGALEAGIRWNAPLDNLYLIAGPSLAIPINYRYDVIWRNSSNRLNDVEMQQVHSAAFGFWGGLGYDLPVYLGSHSQWYITPFIEGSYMMDQKGSDIPGRVGSDEWNTFTVRGGIQMKFGLPPDPYISERIEPAQIPDSPLEVMQ